MTRWDELRSVVLVGTEKRQFDSSNLPAFVPESSPDESALYAAALLGAQRRAGQILVKQTNVPETTEETSGQQPPAKAIQRLEMVLAGSASTAATKGRLFKHWAECCAASGYTVPHELLPAFLDEASGNRQLRRVARPILGQRGNWLAVMNPKWTWAQTRPQSADQVDATEFLALNHVGKANIVEGLRDSDRAGSVVLLDETWNQMKAEDRVACLEAIRSSLSIEDEPRLEEVLDDRSKQVQEKAIELLERLPESRRAKRMIDLLDPLATQEGRLNKKLMVAALPAKPTDAQMRDLQPALHKSKSLVTQWPTAVVAGIPLQWWEQKFKTTPDRLVGMTPDKATEVFEGWARAAHAQGSAEWASALVRSGCPLGHAKPQVATLASPKALLQGIKVRSTTKAEMKRIPSLLQTTRPWNQELSEGVLRWLAKTPQMYEHSHGLETALASNLHPDLAGTVEQSLGQLENSNRFHKSLQRVYNLLSMHNSISEAFQ